MSQTLYIVDAHSLIFQVFHAIPEMSAPDGRPTNAVFGFTRDLLYLSGDKKPDYLICAFDAPGRTFRDDLYAEYKANRSPMPDNLRPQIEMIREVIHAMGIPLIELEGFEADDVVATLTRQATEQGIDTFICTGDKDARQLIGPHVTIYNIRKDLILDAAALASDWGIRPDQVVDLLALTGDSVDNIPGIDGVGPKTASALLQQFGTLDAILANIDRITGKKRQENVRQGAEHSRRARELVVLRADVPVTLDLEASRTGRFDFPKLTQLFRQFGFQTLTAQFSAQAAAPVEWQGTYRAITSYDELATIAATIADKPRLALELVTSGPHPMTSRLVGIALAWQPGEGVYVPIRAPIGDPTLAQERVLDALRPILESEHHHKLGHNLKHHLIVLRRCGVQLAGLELDTMIADYLMEAGERSHNIEQLATRYLKHTLTPLGDRSGTGQAGEPSLNRVADTTQFAGESVDVILRLSDLQQRTLRDDGLWTLFESVEKPLIGVLAEMEYEGVFVDAKVLDRLRREFTTQVQTIEQSIYQLAGGEFNIASPLQLRQVLFDKLKLPVIKKTRTGPSTDQEVLEELAQQHSLPALLLEHRQISKLIGTYVDALPKLVDIETGRVHATFNQVVAATGRLSSSDPNLQNIPIRTALGRQIRQAFAPRPDVSASDNGQRAGAIARPDGSTWQLLTADYSQIELRILAHLSEDEELTGAFAADQDIHSFVASQVFGVARSEITPEMRRVAKTVNFGVIYGLSPFGLASRLRISKQEAEAFIAAYFSKYHGVSRFIRSVLERANREGHVCTLLGRRRRIVGVRSKPSQYLNQSEREAINTVMQGSAADLIKVAMINLTRRMRRDRLSSRMVLQIHDELVFEVPENELDAMTAAVREEMTGAIPLGVPLKVDIARGANWLDVQPIDN
jgi:DNA polymerase I